MALGTLFAVSETLFSIGFRILQEVSETPLRPFAAWFNSITFRTNIDQSDNLIHIDAHWIYSISLGIQLLT